MAAGAVTKASIFSSVYGPCSVDPVDQQTFNMNIYHDKKKKYSNFQNSKNWKYLARFVFVGSF